VRERERKERDGRGEGGRRRRVRRSDNGDEVDLRERDNLFPIGADHHLSLLLSLLLLGVFLLDQLPSRLHLGLGVDGQSDDLKAGETEQRKLHSDAPAYHHNHNHNPKYTQLNDIKS